MPGKLNVPSCATTSALNAVASACPAIQLHDHVAAVTAARGYGAVRVDVVGEVVRFDVVEAGDEVVVGAAAPLAFDAGGEGAAEAGGAGGVGEEEEDVALFGEGGGVPARAPFVEPGGNGAAVEPEQEGVYFSFSLLLLLS